MDAASSDGVCSELTPQTRGVWSTVGGEVFSGGGACFGEGPESAGEIVMCAELMTKGPFMCRADRVGFCG